MKRGILGSRIFDWDDQRRFAELTGDFNPMHMDAVAARRTQAGAPVVHGVHTLLWLLDEIGKSIEGLSPILSITVKFSRMIYIGDSVNAVVTELTEKYLQATVAGPGGIAVKLVARFDVKSFQSAEGINLDTISEFVKPAESLDHSLDAMGSMEGIVTTPGSPESFALLFPSAATLFGPRTLASLGSTTFIVGMVVPGLHSIYGGLRLNFCDGLTTPKTVRFKTTVLDPRFRLVKIAIAGGGIEGELETFARMPPTQQISCEEISSRFVGNEFSGVNALVIGGSRGLGELTAKIIASGGGNVVITYALGKRDAEKLAIEIGNMGRGQCSTLAFDATKPALPQLSSLVDGPTHVYYYATPPIFTKASGFLSMQRLEDFNRFYVSGFLQLIEALKTRWTQDISVFYPSSIAIDQRPAQMTEYAMAKAAGEVLCADMNTYMSGVKVFIERLPRLPTDQTATLQQVKSADPLETILPIVMKVQAQ